MRRVYRDENGNRHWVRGATEQELADKIAEIKQAVKRGEAGINKKMTVEAWSKVWISEYVEPRIREPGSDKKRGTLTKKSARMYRQNLDNHILPAIGGMKLIDVKDVHLQKLLNSKSDMSESAVLKIRIVLHAMFHQAHKSRIIPYDPSDDLSIPAAEAGQRRSLTDYEREMILKLAATDEHGPWVRFLLYTGIRPGESAPLQYRDLNLSCPQPIVKIYKDIESGSISTVSSPKTEAGARMIPIPGILVPELLAAQKSHRPDDYVFPAKDGRSMLTEHGLQNKWRRFAYRLDLLMGAEHTQYGHIYDPNDLNPDGTPIYPDPANPSKPRNGHRIAPDLCPYCLRHTYCTDLQLAGVPIVTVQYLMGHKDVSTTANIYSHPGEAEVISAWKLIDAAAGKEKTV